MAGGVNQQKRKIPYLQLDTGFFFALTQSAGAEGWQAARESVEQRAFSFRKQKRRRINFGLFMPNGMSISFEMQPLLQGSKRKCLCEFCTRDPMQVLVSPERGDGFCEAKSRGVHVPTWCIQVEGVEAKKMDGI